MAFVQALVALTAFLALVGCEERIVMDGVVQRIDNSCALPSNGEAPRWPLRSIRVEVIEWYGGEAGNVIRSECYSGIQDYSMQIPQDVMDWFNEQGYIIRGIPGDTPTRIQIMGFISDNCELRPEDSLGPITCGISLETLTETEFTEDDVIQFIFSCNVDREIPLTLAMISCLSVGSI